MKTKIIGFAGPAGSGKNTAATMVRSIATMRFHPCEEHAFASTLKEMLAVAGFPEPKNREDKEKLIPGYTFSWRKAVQLLGTEWGRGLSPTIWQDIIERKVTQQPDVLHIITDVRFENEASMIRRLGGSVWHLQERRALLGGLGTHASEKPLGRLLGDKCLCNSGGFEFLERQVKGHLDDLGVFN